MDKHPAPPDMYETLHKNGHLPYHLVQDFFHQQYWSEYVLFQLMVNGCGIVLGILFFFFGWGWFWGCPGSFLGQPRGERQVRAGFSGHLGVVLGLSRLRSGEISGEMQVPSRFGHKKLLQKANCPVHFCFLCVFIYVDVCVCMFVIEYVVCVFFLLLFWFFIQCTSFLVFAIYLFNV